MILFKRSSPPSLSSSFDDDRVEDPEQEEPVWESMQRSAVLRWRPLVQVSSRKVLQAVLERHGVPPELFGPVCVVVDKIEKIKAERVPPHPAFCLTCRFLR